ncbi:MAG: glycosyltransferase family 2 protein [Candidatus Scalindua sp.]|nr:glycosyltransferase family 2 protein [Candidatus Scalindua sp.]
MDISFIILTWNSECHVRKCLTTLLTSLDNSKFIYEIFLVDNGSTDCTRSIINDYKDTYSDKILPILLDCNTGTTYSRNMALKRAKGKYIVILDCDVVVSSGSVEKLIKILNNNEKVGLVAPMLTYPDGKLQKSTDTFPTIFSKMFRYLFLKTMENREDMLSQGQEPKEVNYAISAFWVLKRKVIEQTGLLDENIFYAPEDVDYCLRVWKKGYKVLYCPEVQAIHNAQEISRGLKINMFKINHVKGLIYYFRKHKYIFKRPNLQK